MNYLDVFFLKVKILPTKIDFTEFFLSKLWMFELQCRRRFFLNHSLFLFRDMPLYSLQARLMPDQHV